jgi:hypothetical protein
MPLNPGNNTVVFDYPGVVEDRLHKVTAIPPSSTTITGCLMQPISEADKVADTAYSEATDKCLAPVNATTQAAAAEWFIQFNGANYRVLGVRPFYDSPWGRLDHFTFICKAEAG